MLDFLADPESMEGWLDWGGDTTLESYGVPSPLGRPLTDLRDDLADNLPDEHFTFLMNLKSFHQLGDYIFVHAGLRPGVPLAQQVDRDMLWIRDQFFRSGASWWNGNCIVHGHTPVEDPVNKSWHINTDTGAVWTGSLTAVVLEAETRRFLST